MSDPSETDRSTTSRYALRLAPVVDHVRENLADEFSVEALASVARLSPYHFHRVFRAVMGETEWRMSPCDQTPNWVR